MQYSSPRGGTPQHSATTSSRSPREQRGRRRARGGVRERGQSPQLHVVSRVRHKSLGPTQKVSEGSRRGGPTVAGSAVDALARARRRRRSPRLRGSNRRASTYASLPVVALAPTTRVRSISYLASPAGACLQVLTTCRSAASRRASAAVRALREPTCLSIV